MDPSEKRRIIADRISDVADMCLFGILWLLLLVPILTAGAATSAVYKMHYDIRREKKVSTAQFLVAFKDSFKNALMIEIIQILTGGVLGIVAYLIVKGRGLENISVLVGAPVVAVILLWWMIFSYAYAYTAFFEQTIGGTLYNSLIMGIGNIKNTILQMVLSAIVPLCYLVSPGVFIRIIPVIALLGLPLIFWGKSTCYMRVFQEYVSE